MSDEKVVLVSCPQNKAKDISQKIVESHLAACVNIIPAIESIYFWQDKICIDEEALLVIKTTKACLNKLTEMVKEIHPYEIPEIISLPIEDGYNPYLAWINSSCKKGT